MRRVVTLFLSAGGAIACLVAPAVDAGVATKQTGERALSVSICVGSTCAPTLIAKSTTGVVVSLKATAKGTKQTVDRFPAPMKFAGTVSGVGLKCPPTCDVTLA